MDIFKEIVDWAAGLPAWEQEAVRLLLENGETTADDIANLADRVKRGNLDRVKVVIPSPQPMGTRAVALKELEHVCGVNALAEGQVLKFLGPTGLTVIYGENGSGKSGYSRILKHACRSREKRPDPIKGDVYRQGACPTPRARFTYLDGDSEAQEEWTAGDITSDELRTVALFDSNCSRLYVEDDGELAFQPYGLEVFKQLGDTAKAVKDTLDAEANAIAVPTFPSFSHPTILEAISGILGKNDASSSSGHRAAREPERGRDYAGGDAPEPDCSAGDQRPQKASRGLPEACDQGADQCQHSFNRWHSIGAETQPGS